MKEETLTIEKRGVMATSRTHAERVIAIIGWALLLFLIRPLLTVALWVAAGRVFHNLVIEPETLERFQYLKGYFLIILIIYVVFHGWHLYNRIRFRKRRERRTREAPASDTEMAAFYQISDQDVKYLKKQEAIDVHFLADHQIVFEDGAVKLQGLYNPQAHKAGRRG